MSEDSKDQEEVHFAGEQANNTLSDPAPNAGLRRLGRDPITDADLKALIAGIAELSKHVRNVLFALVTTVIFVLLAAMADREASTESEQAKGREDVAERGLQNAKLEARHASDSKDAAEKDLPRLQIALGDATKVLEGVRLERARRQQEINERTAKIPAVQPLDDRLEDASKTQQILEAQKASLASRITAVEATDHVKAFEQEENQVLELTGRADALAREQGQLSELSNLSWDPLHFSKIEMEYSGASERVRQALIQFPEIANQRARESLVAVDAEIREARDQLDRLNLDIRRAKQVDADVRELMRLRRSIDPLVARAERSAGSVALARLGLSQAQKEDAELAPLVKDLETSVVPLQKLESATGAAKEKLDEQIELVRRLAAKAEQSTIKMDLMTKEEANASADVDRVAEKETASSIPLPIISIKVRPRKFFGLGPWVIFFLFWYLRIYTSELGIRAQWLDDAADERGWSRAERLRRIYPWIMNFARYDVSGARVISGLALDWLAPVALAALFGVYLLGKDRYWPVAGSIGVSCVAAIWASSSAARANQSWTSVRLSHLSNSLPEEQRTQSDVVIHDDASAIGVDK